MFPDIGKLATGEWSVSDCWELEVKPRFVAATRNKTFVELALAPFNPFESNESAAEEFTNTGDVTVAAVTDDTTGK